MPHPPSAQGCQRSLSSMYRLYIYIHIYTCVCGAETAGSLYICM
jgi:hypothetical protein